MIMKPQVRTLLKNKREVKYAYTIDLLMKGYSIKEVCNLSKINGIKISENTCRRLKDEFINNRDRYDTD